MAFPVPLEPCGNPPLLSFETPDGAKRPTAVYGEEDPPAKRCLERLLCEAKRPRLDEAQDRLQQLREAQQFALGGAQQTTQVATLLGVPWGEQQVRFLKLHGVTPKKVDFQEILNNYRDTSAAAETFAISVKEAAEKRLTDVVPQQFAEMRHAITSLIHQWPFLVSGPNVVVELARPEWLRGLLPFRPLVRVANNPKKGVCLSFPAEMSRLIQPRRQLFVTFSAQNLGQGSSQQKVSNYDSMPRAEALHEALLDAQGFLVDAAIFQRLREGALATGVSTDFTLRRVGLSELSFMVVLDNEVLDMTLGLRSVEDEATKSESNSKLWSWLADSCLLQLRERHVMDETDPLAAFKLWLQPRLHAAVRYLKGKRTESLL